MKLKTLVPLLVILVCLPEILIEIIGIGALLGIPAILVLVLICAILG